MGIRPTFLGFESSRKSIMAAQKALDITGNNIGNINTEGYTRQRLDLFSVATASVGLRYSSSTVPLAGQGVYAAGVSQLRDPFLDRRYRELQGDASAYETTASILSDIQDVLDNIENDDGLQSVLLDFQTKMQAFATDAADRIELGTIAQTAAKNVTQMLSDYNKKLTQISDQAEYELNASVETVNKILGQIATLNEQIVNEYNMSGSQTGNNAINVAYGPNELLDTRNVLLDQLSQYGNIFVTANDDGSVAVEMAGVTVVDGKESMKLVEDTTDPSISAYAFEDSNGVQTAFDPSGGNLKGYLDMLNGNGPYAQGGQNDEYGIPYYKSVIDTFAQTFADTFNKANGAVDGLGDVDYTSGMLMFDSSDGNYPITAANIQLSDVWMDDPLMIAQIDGELVYKDTQVPVAQSFTFELDLSVSPLPNSWTYDTGTGAYTPPNTTEWTADSNSPIGWKPTATNSLFELNSSGDWVAKTTLPTGWVQSETEFKTVKALDNTHLLELIKVFDQDYAFGTVGDFTGTFEEYISFYTNRLGQQTEFAVGQYESSGAMVNNILQSRDAISAVSMDEEGINMLNYQKWLNASSRMMTTLDEALDTIINGMGLVGRS